MDLRFPNVVRRHDSYPDKPGHHLDVVHALPNR